MSARWSTGWVLTSPVEVRAVGTLIYVERSRIYVERCRLPVVLVSHPVDQPGEVVDQVAAPVDQVGETDPLAARLAELMGAAHIEGRPAPGRRAVARELNISEYRAGLLLARAATTNGTGGRP